MALSDKEVQDIARKTAEEIVQGCRKCTLNTLDSVSIFSLFDDTIRFYSRGRLDDTSRDQIETLRKELISKVDETVSSCSLAEESPLAKIKRDLERATNVEGMLWAIQNFEGALYQSLRDY